MALHDLPGAGSCLQEEGRAARQRACRERAAGHLYIVSKTGSHLKDIGQIASVPPGKGKGGKPPWPG